MGGSSLSKAHVKSEAQVKCSLLTCITEYMYILPSDRSLSTSCKKAVMRNTRGFIVWLVDLLWEK